MRCWCCSVAALAEEPELELLIISDPAEDIGAFPQLNVQGFPDEGEFVYVSAENGIWCFASQTLRVEIIRYQQTEPKPLIWYEAEIWAAEGENWFLPTYEEGKHADSVAWPYIVAQKNQVVFAVIPTCSTIVIPAPPPSNQVGIIIRDGKVYSKLTRKSTSKAFPNCDVLALMPDGSFQVFVSDALTAQDYLNMGVQNTLAFGPWLIRDGVLNEEDLAIFGLENAPRTAVGMVENGHYFAMMLEGGIVRARAIRLPSWHTARMSVAVPRP